MCFCLNLTVEAKYSEIDLKNVLSLLTTSALRRPVKLGCSQVSPTPIPTIVLVGLGDTPKPGKRFNTPGIHHFQVWKTSHCSTQSNNDCPGYKDAQESDNQAS